MYHPTKSNASLMFEITEYLDIVYDITLAAPSVPGMTITSRKTIVSTDILLDCCSRAGVLGFVYMVYGQKQKIRFGVNLLEDLYARYKYPLRFQDPISGEYKYVGCIIDLARTEPS